MDYFPGPRPLVSTGFSLEPDMMFGWRPSRRPQMPVELSYNKDLPMPTKGLCYQSAQAPDSFSIHKFLSSPGSYHFEVSEIIPYVTETPRVYSEGPVQFDSMFESGNLDCAYQVGKDEYDLYMRSDTNTERHMHWFYFAVTNPGHKRVLRFNIVNFSRSTNLYANGMKVRALTKTKGNLAQHWEEVGENLQFCYSKINKMFEVKSYKAFYQLYFEYAFPTAVDKVWFATTIPYTFARLQQLCESLQGPEVECSVLTKSLGLLDIPLITFTNPNIPDSVKTAILIIARVHPSETVSSWVCEGLIKHLCGSSKESEYLKDRFLIKIIPMINPDGVIAGNSRTSMCGDDLNRWYNDPDESIHPELVGVRRLAKSLKSTCRDIYMFIDIHGHFCKKGSFMYGPHFPTHNSKCLKSKLIPKIMSGKTEMFRYFSSRFKEEKNKMGAARMVMANDFGVDNSYTLENSYYGYMDKIRNSFPFTESHLTALGKMLVESIYESESMLIQEKSLQRQRARLKKKKRKAPSDVIQREDSLPKEETFSKEEIFCLKEEISDIKEAWTHPGDQYLILDQNLERLIYEIQNESENFDSPSESSVSEEEEETQISSSLPPILPSISRKQSPLYSKINNKKAIGAAVEAKPRPAKRKAIKTILERWTYNFSDMPEPKKNNLVNSIVPKARHTKTDFNKSILEKTANYTILEYSPIVDVDSKSKRRRPKSLIYEPPKVFLSSRTTKNSPYEVQKKQLNLSQEIMYDIYVPKHHHAIPKRSKET